MNAAFLHEARLRAQLRDVQHDAFILALALHGTNEDTLPAEVCRVLEKYRARVECELGLREPEAEPTDEAMAACTWKTKALMGVDRSEA